jgi:ferrous iron transport protein B
VFYAVALQCVSTLALLAREVRSVKLPIQLFVAYGVLAYLLAFVVYRIVGAITGF